MANESVGKGGVLEIRQLSLQRLLGTRLGLGTQPRYETPNESWDETATDRD